MKRWGRMTKFLSLFCLCLLFIVSCTPKQQTNTPAPSAITSAAGDGRITIGTT
jgi:peptide/nickel transport system substrate-binding protein